MKIKQTSGREDVGASNGVDVWGVGDVFLRDGDLSEHKVLEACQDGLRVLVRRQAWGLARSFTYFMDARVTGGQTRVDEYREVRA